VASIPLPPSVPPLATGAFSPTTGNLSVARDEHTATLLLNGQVLITGGETSPTTSTAYQDDVASAELYNPTTGTFSVTGSMNVGRRYHTTTLLQNGTVLIAGGETSPPGQFPGAAASAELYDPATGSFSFTGNMTMAREFHTATLLANGKVLITGGYNSNNNAALDSAEIYDPTTGVFSPTSGSMITARFSATATLLNSGEVLIAGGESSPLYALSAAELYDPVADKFAAIGNLVNGRYSHTATLLNDGRVLLAGGQGLTAPLAAAEIYDPASSAFGATGNMHEPHGGLNGVGHTATLLNNGQVLVTGGLTGSGDFVTATAEIFDPTANGGVGGFTPAETTGVERNNHTATLLNNGQVLLVGGNTIEAYDAVFPNSVLLASGELFDPVAQGGVNAFVLTADMISGARAFHTATLLNDSRVLLAGGYTGPYEPSTPAAASAELYDPKAGAFSLTGNMTQPRANQSATLLPNGQVLIAGGQLGVSSSTDTYNTAELYDPVTSAFTPTGSMLGARLSHTATLLANGKVLVAGGLNTNTLSVIGAFSVISAAEIYDPATGNFAATGRMVTPRFGHTATLLPSGKVLITGGVSSYGAGALASAELYDPAAGTFTATGSMTTTRVDHTANLLPSGQVLIAGGSNTYLGEGTTSAELYDPATGQFTATARMATSHVSHTATLLSSGQVLIVGGGASFVTPLLIPEQIIAELFDFAAHGGAGGFSTMRLMNRDRQYHTATLLNDGKVLIAGGNGLELDGLNAAEVFEQAKGPGTPFSTLGLGSIQAVDANGNPVYFSGLPATLGTVTGP